MRSCRPRAVALVILLISATSQAACSAPGASSRSLTLFSGQDETTTATLVRAFEQQTGIHVKVRSADEAVLANDLAQPGRSDSADVFYSENTPTLRLLEIRHLLAPLALDTMAKVDPRWRSTAGDWVGVSARIAVMDYNTGKLRPDELPISVMDLRLPRWKGKIGIAPGDTDFQSVVASIYRTN